jgi:carbonic anhydrase
MRSANGLIPRPAPVRQHRLEGTHSGESLPQTLFISCTETQIAPSRFVSRPEQLFELRNIGNIVPPYNPKVVSGAIATIDYALSLTNLRDVVIAGHSGCGAVAVLLNQEHSVSPALRRWLVVGSSRAACQEAVGERTAGAIGKEALDRAAQAHLLIQLAHLAQYPSLESGQNSGRLRLRALFHRAESATTEVYSPRDDSFKPLAREGSGRRR